MTLLKWFYLLSTVSRWRNTDWCVSYCKLSIMVMVALYLQNRH